MSILTQILLSILGVSLLSFIGAFTLLFRDALLKRIVFILVSVSVGALLGDALLHIIPEIFESEVNKSYLSISIFAGIFFFFILEKFLRFRHSHGEVEESKDSLEAHSHAGTKHLKYIINSADALHNLLDGAIITSGFLVSPELGWTTTLAVVLHEIPQEIADFGVLIHSGMSKKMALLSNFISALFAFLGALLVYSFGSISESLTNIILAFAGGGFIYIACSDLVPELHKTTSPRHSLVQVVSIILGFVLMFLLLYLE